MNQETIDVLWFIIGVIGAVVTLAIAFRLIVQRASIDLWGWIQLIVAVTAVALALYRFNVI